jgi:anti-sigma regulatory factor (Ser/Thr protein kinase)
MSAQDLAGWNDLGDVTLASGPKMPGTARAIVSDWLEGCAPASLLDDAQLLVSELVTNSVLYADDTIGGPVRLRAGTSNGSIRFEVGDAGRGGAVARRAPCAEGGGFGLHIVDRLASDWGVTHAAGTEVWFLLSEPAQS